jgi:hypothetical protein
MREMALATDQQSTKLIFKLLHRAGERGLRYIAALRRTSEVQRLAQGKEISDLVQLHGLPRTDVYSTSKLQEAAWHKYLLLESRQITTKLPSGLPQAKRISDFRSQLNGFADQYKLAGTRRASGS